jgi:hypothetical protein
MIISYEREFVFIHVHKTGGDSIAAALGPLLGRGDVTLKSDFQQWMQKVGTGPSRHASSALRKHSTALAVRDYLSAEQWDRFFTFTFVRHPISRAVSLYTFAKMKFEERQRVAPRNLWYVTPMGRRTDPRRWPSVQAYRETGSFSEFLRHPLVDAAPAMRPQWHWVCDTSQRNLVDFVGRFEDLVGDFGVIQDRIGGPRNQLPWRNSSNTGRAPAPILTDSDRALLFERFKEDFAIFGYDPESVR